MKATKKCKHLLCKTFGLEALKLLDKDAIKVSYYSYPSFSGIDMNTYYAYILKHAKRAGLDLEIGHKGYCKAAPFRGKTGRFLKLTGETNKSHIKTVL